MHITLHVIVPAHYHSYIKPLSPLYQSVQQVQEEHQSVTCIIHFPFMRCQNKSSYQLSTRMGWGELGIPDIPSPNHIPLLTVRSPLEERTHPHYLFFEISYSLTKPKLRHSFWSQRNHEFASVINFLHMVSNLLLLHLFRLFLR
jgi:hypothetical protein